MSKATGNSISETADRPAGRRYPERLVAAELVAVAVGGAVGALARWGLSLALRPANDGLLLAFPWATLTANVLGSLALGFLAASLVFRVRHPCAAPFLIVGVLGSFTTFSTLAIEFWQLWDHGQWVGALLYAGVSLAAGLAAVSAGQHLGSPGESKS